MEGAARRAAPAFGLIDTVPSDGSAPHVGAGLSIGGGTSSGAGGDVSVTIGGGVGTSGDDAIGVFAQSVGGGGGLTGQAGDDTTCGAGACPSIVGSGSGSGTAGTVTVEIDGLVATSGQYSHGVFAQSVSGEGQMGGAVTVALGRQGQGARIVASGADSHGIWAQSAGGGGESAIAVTLAAGTTVQGGSGNSAGIRLQDGANHSVTNAGTITTLAGANGVAIRSDNPVAVSNSGVITGSIHALAGSSLLNAPGGRVESGRLLNFGAGRGFVNEGTLSPFGLGRIGRTVIDGAFAQRPGGEIVVDLDADRALADGVIVTKPAELSGTIRVVILDPGGADRGRREVTVLSVLEPPVEATAAAAGPAAGVIPSAVGQYRLETPAPGETALSFDIDFSSPQLAAGLNDNQEAAADYLDALHGAGRIEHEHLYLLEAEDTDAYAEALDQLSPEPYAVSSWAVALSAQQFSNALLSCRERAGDARFIREGQCFRIGLQGRRFERESSDDDIGYDINSGEISLGAQKALSERWQIGAAVAYENWRAEADDDFWRNSGDQFQGGVVVKHQIGSTALSAALNNGFGNVDVRRDATPTATAKGDQDVAFVGGQVRVAHAIELGNWYLKPRSDLSVAWVRTDGVDESGAGAAGLVVEDDRQTYIALQPAIEVGGEFTTDDGYLLRPRVSIGLTRFLKDPSPTAQARFATAPAGSSFATSSDVDRTWVDLEVGVDVLSTNGVNVGLSGFTQLAEDAYHLGGALRLTVPF